MKEHFIKPGFLDRKRKLVLTEDYLEWENGDLKGREFTRLKRSDYLDFKHGMDWIVWYKFTVGRRFSITIKDTKNKELKIRFHSYFALLKENNKTYSDIVNDIWTFHHSHVVNNFLDTFYDKGDAEVQGLKLKMEGVEFTEGNDLVPWDKVATKDYYSYFAIYHKDIPAIHFTVSYNEYGTETLWSAIRTILEEKAVNISRQK